MAGLMEPDGECTLERDARMLRLFLITLSHVEPILRERSSTYEAGSVWYAPDSSVSVSAQPDFGAASLIKQATFNTKEPDCVRVRTLATSAAAGRSRYISKRTAQIKPGIPKRQRRSCRSRGGQLQILAGLQEGGVYRDEHGSTGGRELQMAGCALGSLLSSNSEPLSHVRSSHLPQARCYPTTCSS